MPVVQEATVPGFAHCPNTACPGSAQAPVPVIQRETSYSYYDNGGDMPGIENSKIEFVFAHPADAECPHCSAHRECGIQKRVNYLNLSGFDPNGLNEINAEAALPGPSPADEMAALREQVEQLTATVAAQAAAKPAGKRAPRTNGHG